MIVLIVQDLLKAPHLQSFRETLENDAGTCHDGDQLQDTVVLGEDGGVDGKRGVK